MAGFCYAERRQYAFYTYCSKADCAMLSVAMLSVILPSVIAPLILMQRQLRREKKLTSGANVIKHFTVVSYDFS